MKKILLILFSTTFLISSCSVLSGSRPSMIDPYSENLEATFLDVIKAINETDKTTIKDLFAKNALLQDEDFDESLDLLLSFIQSKIISVEKKGSSGDSSIEQGYTVVNEQVWYSVITDHERYIFVIIECLEDTSDPNNLGVQTLRVFRETDMDKYFTTWEDMMMPGIFVGGESTGDKGTALLSPDDSDN